MKAVLALIDYLRSQGVPPDQIIGAVEAMSRARVDERWAYEAPTVDESAERRRAYDRERMAAKRAAERARTNAEQSADVGGLSADVGKQRKVPPHPPKETTILPPETSYEVSTPKRKRGTRMAPDWKPSPEAWGYGAELGFSAAQLGSELEQFRDYWVGVSGAKGVKLDWDATWRNRLRAVAERKGIAPSVAQQAQGPPAGLSPEQRAAWVREQLRRRELEQAGDADGGNGKLLGEGAGVRPPEQPGCEEPRVVRIAARNG